MGTFTLKLQQFQDKTAIQADQWVRQVALDVWGRLIIRSPVDTGRFRANWMLSIDTPAEGSFEVAGTSGNPEPPPPTPGIQPGQGAGHVIWISNNVPYANFLEFGTDRMPARGMVGLTVMEFAGIAEAAKP